MNEPLLQTPATTLSVSCVIFDTPVDIVNATLVSLAAALTFAKGKVDQLQCEVHLINNNCHPNAPYTQIIQCCENYFDKLITHNGQGNIGYGKANNLAIEQTTAKYHLILNPDVELSMDTIVQGLNYLESHPSVGLVAPHSVNSRGEVDYLAKRLPSMGVIILRGLNIGLLNRLFQNQLNLYAYKDRIPTTLPFEIELASGCFMLCRSDTLKKCKGFSPKYFLYFEDFDLTFRMRKFAKAVFLPSMNIIHLGGNASRKGPKHIFMFFQSALKFMRTLGNHKA